jgi:monoamine oxidase
MGIDQANGPIAIVGAGAAGLMAARALGQRGLDVVVLEARDRIGGRAWTLVHPGVRAPVELGPEFIQGKDRPPISDLLTEARIPDIEVGESVWCYRNGCIEALGDEFDAAAELIKRFQRSAGTDESVEHFLRHFEDQPSMSEAITAVRAMVNGFDAADPAIASMTAIVEEWSGSAGVRAGASRPIGGYGPLLAHVAAVLDRSRVRFALQTIVEEIRWEPGHVSIVARRLNERQTIEARAVIVTVPVGVLQSERGVDGNIRFTPDLPQSLTSALSLMSMGPVQKIILQFDTPFWEDLEDGRFADISFIRAKDCAFPAMWTMFPAHYPIFTLWAGGRDAQRFSSHEAAVSEAVAQMRRIFGNEVDRRLEATFSHDWTSDPFSRGAYSYLHTDGTHAREQLGVPIEGTLFLAGEGTASIALAGTVIGAMQSGLDAAEKVTAALRSG